MTLAYWCVLVAILLPYLCTATAKFTGGDYGRRGNSDPRAFLAGLEGWRKRASNAQLNGFEVTPAFAAAVKRVDQAGGAGQGRRGGHVFTATGAFADRCGAGLADWGPLRSLVWMVGMGLIVSLFVVSA